MGFIGISELLYYNSMKTSIPYSAEKMEGQQEYLGLTGFVEVCCVSDSNYMGEREEEEQVLNRSMEVKLPALEGN